MSVHDLGLARTRKEDDNKKVGVADLLALALDDVKRGEFKNPTRAIICIVDEGANEDGWTFEGYRCGLSRDQEVGVLETYKVMQIRRWFMV
jgi:hypothetical protein